jgi:DNA invertase Pin-like site-specific DNA recombinase
LPNARLTFLYCYSDPLLTPPPNPSAWGWNVDRLYQDLGARSQLQQMLQDCAAEATRSEVYLRVRDLAELGDSLSAIGDCLAQLTQLKVSLLLGDQSEPSARQSPT